MGYNIILSSDTCNTFTCDTIWHMWYNMIRLMCNTIWLSSVWYNMTHVWYNMTLSYDTIQYDSHVWYSMTLSHKIQYKMTHVWYNIIQSSHKWYNTIQSLQMWYNIIQFSHMWYNIIQSSHMWYNIIQSSQMWYNIIRFFHKYVIQYNTTLMCNIYNTTHLMCVMWYNMTPLIQTNLFIHNVDLRNKCWCAYQLHATNKITLTGLGLHTHLSVLEIAPRSE